jgi:hypothetical protein
MGFGLEYQGSRPNFETALQKLSPNKVSSMLVRHDIPAEETASNEIAKGNQVFFSL